MSDDNWLPDGSRKMLGCKKMINKRESSEAIQLVKVEHVHIHEREQAIVGNVRGMQTKTEMHRGGRYRAEPGISRLSRQRWQTVSDARCPVVSAEGKSGCF